MRHFDTVCQQLRDNPLTWLITGVAGFIGSNILEELLLLGQRVRGLDNFATGFRENLSQVKSRVGSERFGRFEFCEGDILHQRLVEELSAGADIMLHQAALGSVPRSIEDPWRTNQVNVDGFLSVILAARNSSVKRFVYASSSSVYGDSAELPKREHQIGFPLSPYAATKRMNEIYAHLFASHCGLEVIGLRYFNVFGPRQNPSGPYAAVIPRWIQSRRSGEPCTIFGDGETSRDFCYVSNVVQANILAACAPKEAAGREYNIACGSQVTLNQIYGMIEDLVNGYSAKTPPLYQPFRPGDVRHSHADISLATKILGYEPEVQVQQGLEKTLAYSA